MFEIQCKILTPDRKRIIAEHEVVSINKPLRAVIAVGGVWIFYYGTSGEEPESVRYMAVVFAAIGLAAVLFAIFSQKLIETNYFRKAAKQGWFPESLKAGKGGIFVDEKRFFSYAEVGGVADYGDCYKIIFLRPGAPGVFIFKEDFGKGDPEAFKSFITEKKAAL